MTSKKELLQLCKTDLSAQAANHTWNKFNNLINNKVKEGKGALTINSNLLHVHV